MEKLTDVLLGNEELDGKVAAMWAEGATAQEVADVLAEAGVETEASQVEELLALFQEKQAEAIAESEVDGEQLKKVAGGQVTCGKPSTCGYSAIRSISICINGASCGDEKF